MPTFLSEYAKKNGLRRVDAKTAKVLTLSPADVKAGNPKDSGACGFAKACQRQMPEVRKVWFFKSTAWVETAMTLTRYHLPNSMQKEIVSFDRSGIMEPGVYKMNAPNKQNTMKEVARRTRRAVRNPTPKRTGRSLKIRHATTNVRDLSNPEV